MYHLKSIGKDKGAAYHFHNIRPSGMENVLTRKVEVAGLFTREHLPLAPKCDVDWYLLRVLMTNRKTIPQIVKN